MKSIDREIKELTERVERIKQIVKRISDDTRRKSKKGSKKGS